MTKKRDVLVHLSREELLAAADRLGVELAGRRAEDANVRGLLTDSKKAWPAVIRHIAVRSLVPSDQRFRQRLVEEGVICEKNETVVFVENRLFNAPSTALAALPERAANGRGEWKDADGRFLHEMRRSALEAAA